MKNPSSLIVERSNSISRKSNIKRALRFVLVGTAGFLTDSATFMLLSHLGANITEARVASFSIAVCVTWLFNSNWTFRDRKSNHPGDFLKYLASQSLGSLVNLSTFFLSMQLSTTLQETPVLAIAIASITAMTFNYLACHLFVFRDSSSKNGDRPRKLSRQSALRKASPRQRKPKASRRTK